MFAAAPALLHECAPRQPDRGPAAPAVGWMAGSVPPRAAQDSFQAWSPCPSQKKRSRCAASMAAASAPAQAPVSAAAALRLGVGAATLEGVLSVASRACAGRPPGAAVAGRAGTDQPSGPPLLAIQMRQGELAVVPAPVAAQAARVPAQPAVRHSALVPRESRTALADPPRAHPREERPLVVAALATRRPRRRASRAPSPAAGAPEPPLASRSRLAPTLPPPQPPSPPPRPPPEYVVPPPPPVREAAALAPTREPDSSDAETPSRRPRHSALPVAARVWVRHAA